MRMACILALVHRSLFRNRLQATLRLSGYSDMSALPPLLLSLSQSEPRRTPVAVRMDTIDDGSAHCEKVEAYCIRHEKQNERWASNRKDECGTFY
ncbi:hypothetical protein EDD17DRAFT_1656075 [Pisolithus thermaeus]|nr:hypothetical protein EDD17DRAFT_1656075 [Pisolithus thermaeus]